MATKTIRTILALDGEAEFRNKIKQINSNLSVMKANMKSLTSEYERNGGKVKNLSAQKQQLREQITQLKGKMTVLNEAVAKSKTTYDKAVESYHKAVQEHGKDSEEAQKAAHAVTKAEQSYNSFRTQLINTDSEMKAANKQLQDISNSTNKFNAVMTKAADAVKAVGSATANAGIETMKASLSGVAETAKLAAEGLAAYAAGAAASAAAVGKYSLTVGTSFEAGMSGVAAIANSSAEDMDMLTEKAKALGSSSKFTATEVSEGFNFMAMAGWKAEEMMEGIDGVINLAAASGEELGLVSDMVTDSLTAFKMPAKDAGKYADILAQASSNANTNVAMMGETFQYCAPIAGAMGYKVEDLSVAVGLMANAGIKGSMAGTSLRSVITNLAAPTDAASNAMETLGIKLTNEDGTMKSFQETVEQLRNGFAGLSEAEKAASAKAIAGKPGMSGLLALINASDADYQQLRDSIDNAAGSAERMAKIKLDNLKGDVTILKSATEGLGLAIYETFSKRLRGGVQQLTGFVNRMSLALKRGQNLTAVFKRIGNQIRDELPKVFGWIQRRISDYLSNYNEAIVQIVQTVTAAIPEITTRLLPPLIAGFNDLVLRLIDILPSFAGNVVSGAKKMFEGLFTGLKAATERLNEVIPEILSALLDADAAKSFFRAGIDILMNIIKGITANISQVTDFIAEVLPDIVRTVAMQIPALVGAAVDVIVALINSIDFGELVDLAVLIIEKLAEGITENSQKLAEALPVLIDKVVGAIVEHGADLYSAAIKLLGAIGQALVDCVSTLIEYMPQIINDISDKFKAEDWEGLGRDIMTRIAKGLRSAVSEIATAASEARAEMEVQTGFKAYEALGNASTSFADVVSGPLRNYGFDSLANTFTAGSTAFSFMFGDVTINNDKDIDDLVEQTSEAVRQAQLSQGRR